MSNSVNDRQRAVSSAIIEKIMNDPAWRQQLVETPEGALRDAGFLDEFTAVTNELQSEVSGYALEIEAPGEASSKCCVTVIY